MRPVLRGTPDSMSSLPAPDSHSESASGKRVYPCRTGIRTHVGYTFAKGAEGLRKTDKASLSLAYPCAKRGRRYAAWHGTAASEVFCCGRRRRERHTSGSQAACFSTSVEPTGAGP